MPSDRTADDESSHDYAKALGTRLRAARARQHLSLQGVERRSDGRWKAVVIGSYERGDRAISVHRLVELAAFYGVTLGEILPSASEPANPAAIGGPLAKVILNMTRVRELSDPEAGLLVRFVAGIQGRRHANGRVNDSDALAIRRDDLRTLALMYDETEDAVTERLLRWQVLAPDSVILDGEP